MATSTLLNALKADAVIERVKTNSILNPLLWLCGIIEIPALPLAYWSTGYVKIFFCTLSALPVISSLLAYFIFMFRDPDRLQSEEYQLEHQKILQGSKEHNTFPTTLQTIDHTARAPVLEADVLALDTPPIDRPNNSDSEDV